MSRRKISRRRMERIITLVAGIVLALLAANGMAQVPDIGLPTGSLPKLELPQTVAVPPGFYSVTDVADGDTITVEQNGYSSKVRLIGIDTPETRDPRTTVQCFGQAASDKTKELLAGQPVRLEADPTNTNQDKYGRLLRYVYLQDGRLVNAELVRQGYAFAYTLFPFQKMEEFRAHERHARDNNLGLWGACDVDESSEKKTTV